MSILLTSSLTLTQTLQHGWDELIFGAVFIAAGLGAAWACVTGRAGQWRPSDVPVGRLSAAAIATGAASVGGGFVCESLGIGPPHGVFTSLAMIACLAAAIGHVMDRAAARRRLPKPFQDG